MAKKMDHIAYPKRLRNLPENALRFIAKDAKEAIAANPDNVNNSYYADEICYVCSELHRRANLHKNKK